MTVQCEGPRLSEGGVGEWGRASQQWEPQEVGGLGGDRHGEEKQEGRGLYGAWSPSLRCGLLTSVLSWSSLGLIKINVRFGSSSLQEQTHSLAGKVRVQQA